MTERYWDVWDKDLPVQYERSFGAPDDPTPEQLQRMLIGKSLLEGDSVLDMGCGIGHFYHVLPSDVKYLGVDSSIYMVEYARRYATADFREGDIYDMDGLPMYDSVITQSVLIHLPEIEGPIREMWKHALKVIIFSIPIAGRKVVRTWREVKDKKLLSHAETIVNIEKMIMALPGYWKHIYVVEPGKLNNVYFKVWRRSHET